MSGQQDAARTLANLGYEPIGGVADLWAQVEAITGMTRQQLLDRAADRRYAAAARTQEAVADIRAAARCVLRAGKTLDAARRWNRFAHDAESLADVNQARAARTAAENELVELCLNDAEMIRDALEQAYRW